MLIFLVSSAVVGHLILRFAWTFQSASIPSSLTNPVRADNVLPDYPVQNNTSASEGKTFLLISNTSQPQNERTSVESNYSKSSTSGNRLNAERAAENEPEEGKMNLMDEHELKNQSANHTSVDEGLAKEESQIRESISTERKCLPYLLYDKPVKTGSTAITAALENYLIATNRTYFQCKLLECGEAARKVCDGSPPHNFILHIAIMHDDVACLKRRGYYSVTSVRKPKERWISAWLYLQQKNKTHYNLPVNITLEQFVGRFPNCALLHYYDRQSSICTGEVNDASFVARIDLILSRFDEIIDLNEVGPAVGDVQKRIQHDIKQKNVSSRSSYAVTSGFRIDPSRLKYEEALYAAMKKRQQELVKENSRRVLCHNRT